MTMRTLLGAALLCMLAASCGRTEPAPAPTPPAPSQPTSAAPTSVAPEFLARFNRAVGLLGSFSFEDAEEAFAQLVAEPTGRPDVDRALRLNLAIAILNQSGEGAQERALELLERLIAEDANDVRARYCAGLVELFLGRPEAALPHFAFAAERDPRDPFAAFYVGQGHEFAGRHAEAIEAYRASAALDPYLRSPLLGLQRSLGRLGRDAEAEEALAAFRRLADNPRSRLAEFKYTRMGAKGEAFVPEWAAAERGPEPTPPFFEDRAIEVVGSPRWRTTLDDGGGRPSITVADIDGDGRLDLLLANAIEGGGNAVLLADGDAPWRYRHVEDHPFAGVSGVEAALWGDVDNDGRLDVYFCRRGPNMLFGRDDEGRWSDRTAGSGTDGGDRHTLGGLLVDLDHDGDLDLYLCHSEGPAELLANAMDGTFRPIGALSGAIGDGRPVRQALAVDIDRDRDVDLVLVHDAPPHALLRNDRLWRFEPVADFPLADAALEAIVALDHDANGQATLVGLDAHGGMLATTADGERFGTLFRRDANAMRAGEGGGIAVADVAGSGRPGIVHRIETSFVAFLPDGDTGFPSIDEHPNPARGVEPLAWSVAVLGERGPAIVVLTDEGLSALAPTEGRGAFLTIVPSGLVDPSQAMRSNASGVGARFVVRTGDRWSVVDSYPASSLPGQSLQPLAIGLGAATRADFISIDWSDGVFQTELALDAGRTHRLVETQRQISSCPVLFAWDGERFRFVTDVLGVGGIGYLAAIELDEAGRPRPIHVASRPWERLALPQSLPMVPKEGLLELRLGEPMEEALYLDAARLVAYDLPPGWSMTVDDRFGLVEPLPTGEPRFFRRELLPSAAFDGAGRDVLDALAAEDGRAVDVSRHDARFLGRLAEPHTVTILFDEPIDALPGTPTLVMHGWIEYPYSQTTFSAWQAGATFIAPDLEARDAAGHWHRVYPSWGFPAGMPREASLPLVGLPPGTTALRMTTTQEIYWDRLSVVGAEPCPGAVRHEAPLVEARVAFTGFPARADRAQRRPDYDYARRARIWGARYLPGFHTAYGDCLELVAAIDDAVAIVGPGEEVRLRFVPPPPPPAGFTRRWVFETEGWCKDMDLFTGDGESLEPLPLRDPAAVAPARDELHRRFQTRWAEGD